MLKEIREEMRALAVASRAEVSRRYFRTGPGEYGEGDVFMGLSVPQVRMLARKHRDVDASVRLRLLRSRIHEERLLGLFLMVRAFERGDETERKKICGVYLANRRYVNNWDLVDGSAPNILGAWLLRENAFPKLLTGLAGSKSLWDRRIAVLATLAFIKQGRFEPTLHLAEMLLGDGEDLIHKAVGWMLREVGRRDSAAEEAFVKAHRASMPRTMLRYALEKFPEAKRRRYMRR